jgi:hypothetical protein
MVAMAVFSAMATSFFVFFAPFAAGRNNVKYALVAIYSLLVSTIRCCLGNNVPSSSPIIPWKFAAQETRKCSREIVLFSKEKKIEGNGLCV